MSGKGENKVTIKELDENYYFHDSCITHISFSEEHKELEIVLDFCNWAQKDYKSDDPELVELKLTFYGVSDYTGPVGEIDYYSVVDSKTDKDRYYLRLEDDINKQFYEISIMPSNIEATILGPVTE